MVALTVPTLTLPDDDGITYTADAVDAAVCAG